MAKEGLIIDVDYNITKAEAKQRKLNRDMEISVQKAENIKKEIQQTEKEISDCVEKQKQLNQEFKKTPNPSKKEIELTAELEKQKKQIADINKNYDLQFEKIKEIKSELANLDKSSENYTKDYTTLYELLAEEDLKLKEISIKKEEIKQKNTSISKLEKEIAEEHTATTLQHQRQIKTTLSEQEQKQRGLEKTLSSQNLSLKKQNAETAKIGDQIILNGKKQSKFSQAFEKSTNSANRFGERLKSLITSALFFSLVTKAFTALRNEFGKLITETGTKTAKLVSQLNGNLAIIGRTLYESARPAIEWILQVLVKMTNILANGLAKILGKNVNEMKKLAQQTKKTGEEAKKTTAGFDTLQTINTSSSSSGAETGVGTDFGALTGDIDGEVALLMAILSGALLILGVILAFTGINIPLGIGLIVAGAIGLATAVVPNWNDLPDNIQNVIIGILAIVSVALLVLGAIFVFTGHIALGVGFLILGAVGLATAAAITMNKLPDDIKNTVSIISAIVGGALLVLGIILLATGVAAGLGLGLLVAGASLLAGTIAANWNTLPEKTRNIISAIMGIGGLLMLIIGIILTCTGNLPLGIPLIVIGAAGLVSAVALNWNALTDKIKKIGASIGKIFKNCWDGIKKGFKAMVNGIIGYANLWIDGLNLLLLPIRGLITGVAKAFGSDIKLKDVKIPHIPKLATGAILPGGSPMLAWVNDQPKGQPYVEGSIENIAAAFKEYLGAQPKRNLTIEATGSWSQFLRYMRLQLKEEDTRASIF